MRPRPTDMHFNGATKSLHLSSLSRWIAAARDVFKMVVFVLAIACNVSDCFAARGGELTIRAVDAATRQPCAARMHLKNARNRPVKPTATNAFFHGDHFVFDGETTLALKPGKYTFEMETGPEFKLRTGHFTIADHASDETVVEMHRFANLADEGWFAGDLHVARPARMIDQLMRAEEVHVVPLIAEQTSRAMSKPINAWSATPEQTSPHHWFSAMAAFDRAEGAGLIAFDAPQMANPFPFHLKIANSSAAESGYSLPLNEPTGGGATPHLDIANPFSWRLPIWLALAEPDSFQLISSHALRNDATDPKSTGRPRDSRRFPGKIGAGIWAETIYYHALNAGLRIPPSAGSGSGDSTNPVGQNRVYVHCDDDFSYATWWNNLREGKVFVTNGPLLRVEVEGERPGAVFHLDPRESRAFQIGLTLSTREPIDYLQVIKNGRVETEVRLDEFVKTGGRLPPVEFDASGWFLVRAVTTNQNVYQFASTGPFYVEAGYQPFIDGDSVQFFIDWIDAIPENLRDPSAIELARAFWTQRTAAP